MFLGGYYVLKTTERPIPMILLNEILRRIVRPFPFHCRGIKVTQQLVIVTLECLNGAPANTFPQNCRNEVRSKTPEGLDLCIKNNMKFDTRTGNIISDILAEAGIVKVTTVTNQKTGRSIKATQLLKQWTW